MIEFSLLQPTLAIEEEMAMRRCLQERLTRVLGRFHHDPVCSHQPFESSWLSQPYLGLGAAGANAGFASDSSTARKPYGMGCISFFFSPAVVNVSVAIA